MAKTLQMPDNSTDNPQLSRRVQESMTQPTIPPQQPDMASLAVQAMQAQMARQASLQQQVDPLIAEKAAMPTPKMGPSFDSGAGFKHNLGQALLMIAAMTRPGQQVEKAVYGKGATDYSAKQNRLSSQISEIQGQQGEAVKGEQAAGSAGSFGEKVRHDVAGEENARARIEAYKTFHDNLTNILNSKLDLQQQGLEIRKQLGLAGIQVQEDRNQILLSLGGQKITLDANKFNAAVENKNQGFFDQIGEALGFKNFQGVGTSGTVPVVTGGGASSVPAPTQNAPAKPAAKPTGKGKVLVEGKDF